MNAPIKRLGPNDTTLVAQLNALFGTVFKDQSRYEVAPPSIAYLTKWITNQDNIALVALHDNDIIGGLVAYTLHKLEQERSEIYIYDLAVSTSYHRLGIATKLVNTLRLIAKQDGAYVMFVQTDEGDPAVNFYESLKPSENIRTRSFDFNVE